MSGLTHHAFVLLAVFLFSSSTFAGLPMGRFIDARPVDGINVNPWQIMPAISSDGLELFFVSSGGGTGDDIYSATRTAVDMPFGHITELSSINSPVNDDLGGISEDGLTLYFGSGRSGNWELYQATRRDRGQPFGNITNLGPGVNTNTVENGPNVVADGKTLFFHRRDAEGLPCELWMAERGDVGLGFDNAVSLGPAVNDGIDSWFPSASSDGLFVFFADICCALAGPPVRPDDNDTPNIWVTFRSSMDAPFGPPVDPDDLWPGTDINTDHGEGFPYISPDWPAAGSKIYWGTARDQNLIDIWEATWVVELQPGDANQNLEFDQLDLVRVLMAGKYLSGQPATWGEGDWNGAPGGEPGNPPEGDGLFDQLDIIRAIAPGHYLTGSYGAINPRGTLNDTHTSILYNAVTGEIAIDAPAGQALTSINIDSTAGIFTGQPAQNLGGSFDNNVDTNIFKATFGSSFGSISFGPVARQALPEDFVAGDLTVVGSLEGGGDLGDVDLIYIPEPSAIVLTAFGLLAIACRRPRPNGPQ